MKKGVGRMKWREIFEKLKNEKTISIPYEASISLEIDSFVADIPVYKFKVQYFTKEDGMVEKYCKTFDELMFIINSEEAFRKCSECGDLITGGFIANHEMDKDYCCPACMIKSMDRQYGSGMWRFKAAQGIIDEEDDTIETNEYQYEIMSDLVRLEVFKHMMEEQGREIVMLEPETEEEQDDSQDVAMVRLEEMEWIPYRMYYCPPLNDGDIEE